jgi:hypothetical protein
MSSYPENDMEREIETGISSITSDETFVLLFRGSSKNDYQASTVNLSILAEAKQHRNTGADTWASLKTFNVTFAGANASVVDAETVITNQNGQYTVSVAGSHFTHNAPETVVSGGQLVVTLTPDSGYSFTSAADISVSGGRSPIVMVSNGTAQIAIGEVTGNVAIVATPRA